MNAKLFRLAAVAALALLSCIHEARAELKPDQIVILVNKKSEESVRLGKLYAERRAVPLNHIVELALPLEDTISREGYERDVVVPLRKALEERKLAASTRVLLSIYGVPLRVAAPEAKDDEKQALLEALSMRETARKDLLALGKELDATGIPSDPKAAELEGMSDEDLTSHVQNRIGEAVNRLYNVGEEGQNREARIKVNNILARFGGVSGVVRSLRVPEGSDNQQARDTIAKLQKDVQSAQRLLLALDQVRTPQNRQRAYSLTMQTFGISGVLGRVKAFRAMYEYQQADASLDSELSFLWWDRRHYVVSDRTPNPYHHRFSGKAQTLPLVLPVLLSARLDAPKPELVAKMIENAIAAEKNGLKGKAYVDSRGLKEEGKTYLTYDASLKQLAELLDDKSGLDVEHEGTEKRFSDPGDADEVALYVGWYRVRQYENAFAFNPGAVGYHIASEEAVSLHDPGETGWCKNALEHGITATLGPTNEPYLDSFPLPLEFFGLLLTGKYTLLEVYALTSSYVSWRMLLIGDPLYNPFAGKNLVTGKDIADASDGTAVGLDPLPASPLDGEFPDPIAGREKIAKQQVELTKEIEAFYKALNERVKERQKEQAKKK